MMKIAMFAFLTVMLVSCKEDLYLKDNAVVVTNRFYSPDSAYVAYIYYIDNGAMGESWSMASVMKVGDTLGSLNKGRLPCHKALTYNSCYFPDNWIDNKTLEVTLPEISFAKAGLPFDSTAIKVNGVDCTVVPYDNSGGRLPLVKHLSFSADRKKMLVIYEYNQDLNISVIKYGDKLPKYGNLVAMPFDNGFPIRHAAWNGGAIDLYMKDARMYKLSDYVNEGSPYTVNFVELDELRIPADSVLYVDARIDTMLNTHGVTTKAVVKRMPSDFSGFKYEYEFQVAGQRFRCGLQSFRDSDAAAHHKGGDSIEVVYDPGEPMVHRRRL